VGLGHRPVAVDEGREPLVPSRICAPAVEIEVVAYQRGAAIGSVETDNVIILILHPDPADEASFVVLPYGSMSKTNNELRPGTRAERTQNCSAGDRSHTCPGRSSAGSPAGEIP